MGQVRAGTVGQVGMASEEVTLIPIDSLQRGDSPRLNGVSREHVQLLCESGKELSPIIVHRHTMRVIDGMHRLAAARLVGMKEVPVTFFDGSDFDAFIESVQANNRHGLPLTLADREAAVLRILASQPQCSDRWIAQTVGLAPGTVGSIRHRRNPGDDHIQTRVGRDGRIRPLDTTSGRMAAAAAMAENPDASLREIAKLVGLSPATVLDVRNRMQQGERLVPPGSGKAVGGARSVSRRVSIRRVRSRVILNRDRTELLEILQRDPSLHMSESGRSLIRWLRSRAVGPGDFKELIDSAPDHCLYAVAEVVMHCAREWQSCAEELQHKLGSLNELP